jgi:hypothetical protein
MAIPPARGPANLAKAKAPAYIAKANANLPRREFAAGQRTTHVRTP